MRIDAVKEERIGAFFDLDGTLIPEPSLERRLFGGLQRNGAIPFINYVRWISEAGRLLPDGINCVLQNNKSYLHGMGFDQAIQTMETITFYEKGLERVAWHARRGHRIVIVSGTLEPLANLAAKALGCELEARGVESACRVCATRLEEKKWRWTGRFLGEAMRGEAKARAICQIAREEKLDLNKSYAYGNSLEDRHMFSAVGLGQAVNPRKELAKLAELHNWRIWNWIQTRETLLEDMSLVEEGIQKVESRL